MKLSTGFFVLFMSLATQVMAQDMTSSSEHSYSPPAYQVVRFRENYEYLSDPSLRQDAIFTIENGKLASMRVFLVSKPKTK